MMFIVRSADGTPPFPIKMTRRTPSIVPGASGRLDYFCLGDPAAAREAGWPVIAVHDGWYAGDQGGGVAIWGQGVFWEVRETPFKVTEACGPVDEAAGAQGEDDVVNVRAAIFRG